MPTWTSHEKMPTWTSHRIVPTWTFHESISWIAYFNMFLHFLGYNNSVLAIVCCAVFSNLGTSMVWHAMRQLAATKTFLLEFFHKNVQKNFVKSLKDSDNSLNQIVVCCLPWQQKLNSRTIANFTIFIGV